MVDHEDMFRRRRREIESDGDAVGTCFYCGDDVWDGEEVFDHHTTGVVVYHHACYDEDLLEEI